MARPTRVVLASASATRRRLLASAGVEFEVVPAKIDEGKLRAGYLSDHSKPAPWDVALWLARAKAEEVARRRAKALVIGADQVLSASTKTLISRLPDGARRLDLANHMVSKATDLTEAFEVLRALRGKWHELHSAVVVVGGGAGPWEYVATARLKMRKFSDEFLEAYLAGEGENLLASVGCYRIEDRGIQLFERVAGDHSVILGLPLLPVLAELRRRGALPQ